MKQIRIFLLILFMNMISISVSAYDFEVGGLCYNYNDGVNGTSVSVTYKSLTPNTYGGNVVIPAKVTYNNHTYNVTSIGDYTFASCNLTEVAIPLGVTRIGHHAFSSCKELYSITIPNSVTSIEWSAFYECTSLSTITIPNSVKTIGEGAFADCSNLYSVTIGNSVTIIGGWAFRNCSSLNTIIIPNSVITIGASAFQGCAGLWTVTIGNSVRHIGTCAFSDCLEISSVHISDLAAWCSIEFEDKWSNPLCYQKSEQSFISDKPVYKSPQLYVNGQIITDLVIPNTVTSINDYVFNGCNYLESVVISNSVKTIGNFAFQDCYSLSSVTISDFVESIGDNAFSNCWNLTSLILPGTLNNIGNYAFSDCKKISTVIIPNSVTSIGTGAFYGCKAINSITIPSSVITIGAYPFAACENLVSINVDNGNPAYNSNNNCNAIIHTETGKLVSGCSNTVIPITVTSIGERAFEHCSGLTSINIPNSVTEIGEYAFAWSNLLTISFSSNLQHIGRAAFSGTPWYKNLSDGLIYAGSVVLGYKNTLPSNVTIKDGTLGIAAWAFQGCNNLQTITLPISLTSIGDHAFMNCRSLTSFNIPNSTTSIGDYAFWGCSGFSSVDIPNSVKYLGEGAFRECTSLTSVSIGNSITSIEPWTFSGCPYLSSIVIPNSVTSIGDAAFYGCTYLESITTPQSVTTIYSSSFWGTFDGTAWYNNQPNGLVYAGEVIYKYKGTMPNETKLIIKDGTLGISSSAFWGQNGLTSLTIPNSIVYIGNYAFEECRNLTEVIVKRATPISINSGTFTNRSYATLYVPKGSKDAYEASDYWKEFKEIVELNKYQLIYIIDGEIYKKYEICEGDAITPGATPTKEGYSFSGWSEIPETMPANDVTVTGTFTINKYKLTYLLDGEVYKSFEIEYGTEITPEAAPTKEGYTFSGWSEIPQTMPAQDVTVTGTFSINKYKLTYLVDGETYKEYDVEYGESITPEPAPTKEGYSFSGWSNIPSTMPANDVTVTGTFSKGSYTLTYIVDGVTYKTVSYDYGETITPEDNPTKEGYTFSGWSEIPATMPARDITVTSAFIVNKYILTYIVDNEIYKTYEVEYGASITPEDAPTKEGYAFSDWSEIPATMPCHDVTVTGRFYSTDNMLKIKAKEVCAGISAVLPVELVNKAAISAFEFTVCLPKGVTLAGCELTGRKGRDHTCSSSILSLGEYKVVAYSGTSRAFSETEGVVINLTLNVSKETEIGEYAIILKDIELTTTDTESFFPADVSAKLTVREVLPGDANGDGRVSISDVVAIVNHIIGRTPAKFVIAAADVNGDGNINVFDVTKTVNMILGIDEEDEAKMRDADGTSDGLMTMERNGDGMNLMVEKPANYVAMQFDVIVPDGSFLQDAELNGCADHAVAFDRTGENRYTVIAYSMNNAAFTADALVNIALSDGSKSVCVENAMGVTTDGRCVLMDVMDKATAIAGVKNSTKNDAIYNLSGQCVGLDAKTLPKGVYIRGGKKVVVGK